MSVPALPIEIPSIVLERVRALWQHKDLALGIRGIDAQHVWLVALVLQLEWLLHHEPESVSANFRRIVEEAKDYALRHFEAEERLFHEFHFTEEDRHIKTHRSFADAVARLASETNVETSAEAEKLQKLLRDWLILHIRGEDRKYGDFFRRRKLLDEANRFFDAQNADGHLVSSDRMELLALVSKKQDIIECTTPEVLHEIASIWNRLNLRIGVPLIDIQHVWLIKMIVDMDEAMNESPLTREAVLAQTIAEAIDYISVHFRTEEALMEVIGFETATAHKQQHKFFEEFVAKRKEEFQSGNQRDAMTLVNDLREWLTNHIALEDKALVSYYQAHKEAALDFSKKRILSGEAGIRQNQISLYQAIVETGRRN